MAGSLLSGWQAGWLAGMLAGWQLARMSAAILLECQQASWEAAAAAPDGISWTPDRLDDIPDGRQALVGCWMGDWQARLLAVTHGERKASDPQPNTPRQLLKIFSHITLMAACEPARAQRYARMHKRTHADSDSSLGKHRTYDTHLTKPHEPRHTTYDKQHHTPDTRHRHTDTQHAARSTRRTHDHSQAHTRLALSRATRSQHPPSARARS